MTGAESRLLEISTVKDGLLNSELKPEEGFNGALQTQWQLIRDGMAQGAGARLDEAGAHAGTTSLAVAGSFGLGAGFGLAMKAGGRWAQAAEVIGAGMLGMMGVDLYRRGSAVHEAYAKTSADSLTGQQMRRDAIATNLGAGLVDYSVAMASGGLGVASVYLGPKLATRISSGLDNMPRLSTSLEPSLVPVRANTNFRLMDLAENGRLGAKELAAKDPISLAREKLDFPHRSVGLDQLASLVEAKQIAAHPQVRPLYEQLGQTLSKVDGLKPLIAADESALAALSKQASEIKLMKPELQAVRTAESAVNGIKADLERLPLLKEQQSSLSRQIQEASKSAENTAAGQTAAKNKEPGPSVEDLKATRRELSDSIRNIQERSAELPNFEQRLASARQAFESKRQSIDSGTNAELAALESQMKPLQDSLAARKSELVKLTDELAGLNSSYQLKADEVRPGLAASDSATLPPLPKYEKPKVDLPEPPAGSKPQKPVRAETEKPPLPQKPVLEKPPTEKPLTEKIAVSEKPVTDKAPPKPEKAAERTASSERVKATEKVSAADRVVTAEQLSKSFEQAKQAVDDFAATQKRHTTALKKVNEYIEDSFQYFATDSQAAANASKIAANVDSLLAGLKDWNRSPGWIRTADRAQIMQRNGFDAATMERFDSWYQTQNKPFHEGRSMSADRRLLDIHDHLARRVAVESVKNWLRTAPDVNAAVSPIVQKGFEMVASGKLPDGKAIPKGSDMIVFEKTSIKGANGPQEAVLPFAKDGHYMMRFDDSKIISGLAKLETMTKKGPSALAADDVYAFRLDHDPARLLKSGEQVGFAVLRPGSHGKNVLYMEFVPGLDTALIPRALRADNAQGAGTNTGVLYNLLRDKTAGKK